MANKQHINNHRVGCVNKKSSRNITGLLKSNGPEFN